jgi:hypothetical protein
LFPKSFHRTICQIFYLISTNHFQTTFLQKYVQTAAAASGLAGLCPDYDFWGTNGQNWGMAQYQPKMKGQ